MLLAGTYQALVDGVDCSPSSVWRAQALAQRRHLSYQVRFSVGDVARLNFPDASFDAVVCESALCALPDKASAAAGFARVLRPGGRVGITDVSAQADHLPTKLRGLSAWIAGARPIAEYEHILRTAGLRILRTEPRPLALIRVIDQIEARLRRTAARRVTTAGFDPAATIAALELARATIRRGVLGLHLLVAERAPVRPANKAPHAGRAIEAAPQSPSARQPSY